MKKILLCFLILHVTLSHAVLGSAMRSKLFTAGTALAAMTTFANSVKDSVLNPLDQDKNNELGNVWKEDKYSIFDFFAPKKEMIVHRTSNEEALKSILLNGLCSTKKLAESRLGQYTEEFFAKWEIEHIDYLKKKFGFLDKEQIFFAPKESDIGKSGNIGILVDPNKTYVFNLAYKAKIDPSDINLELYKKSKILLSTYLKHQEEAKKMQKAQPDKTVLLDPQTAKPFYADRSYRRPFAYNKEIPFCHDGPQRRPFSYHPEIPFNKDHISPAFLHFIQKDTFEVNFNILEFDDIEKSNEPF